MPSGGSAAEQETDGIERRPGDLRAVFGLSAAAVGVQWTLVAEDLPFSNNRRLEER